MAETFPRLLIATEFPPNASGGGPAVVRQMLKSWPVEKLYWWSCLPEDQRKFGQHVAAHRVATIPHKLYPHQRWCAQKSWLLENAWAPWAAGHFRRTLKEFQPDAIWVIPHLWAIPPLRRWQQQTPAAFHVSIHDYMDAASCITRLGLARSRRMAAGADQLYRAATSRDAICQPMIEDLRARTGCDGLIARAGLEQEDFDFLAAPRKTSRDKIQIAYAGTIQAENAFAVFVAALGKIRRQLTRPVSLEFFGSHSYRNRSWFDAMWMNEHGNLPLPELSAALKKCTWGFSPMSLTNDDPRYNQFSLPTKFISYLAAGLPVITLGHPESSLIKMASVYDIGLCSTTADEKLLGEQLLARLQEPDPGTKFHNSIQQCAQSEFDAQRIRATFCDCLRKGRLA